MFATPNWSSYTNDDDLGDARVSSWEICLRHLSPFCNLHILVFQVITATSLQQSKPFFCIVQKIKTINNARTQWNSTPKLYFASLHQSALSWKTFKRPYDSKVQVTLVDAYSGHSLKNRMIKFSSYSWSGQGPGVFKFTIIYNSTTKSLILNISALKICTFAHKWIFYFVIKYPSFFNKIWSCKIKHKFMTNTSLWNNHLCSKFATLLVSSVCISCLRIHINFRFYYSLFSVP